MYYFINLKTKSLISFIKNNFHKIKKSKITVVRKMITLFNSTLIKKPIV